MAERATGAHQLIIVGDRESDIFALLARRPAPVELVVRAAQDRSLADGTRLFACAGNWPSLGACEVRVGPRGPGDKGRTAVVGLRAGAIRVARPRHGVDLGPTKQLDLTLVEVREEQPPAGSEAMKWQAVARPTAPPQTCGANRRFWAWASVAMRLASVRPPTVGIEGCTMSMQRPSIRARKSRTV